MSPKLSRENIKNITESFYSKFCGTDISALSKGAYFVSSKGICPQWDCAYENNASAKLAEAVGYREYALAYILEE